MKERKRNLWVLLCHGSAVLAPLAWLYFIPFVRNPFDYGDLTLGGMLLCLAGSVLPMLLSLLAQVCSKGRDGKKTGWVFAACCLVLAALCWLFTLGTGWMDWGSAMDMGRLPAPQLHRLRLCGIVGLGSALAGLVPVWWGQRKG